MEELNTGIKHFMRAWNKKVHGTTGRIPDEMYEEEKTSLNGPYKKKVIDTELEIRTVSTDSFVMVGTNKYSVSVRYVDKQVKIRIVYGYILEIYDFDLLLIKSYPILNGKYKKMEDAQDYKDIAVKVPSSIPEIRRVFEKTFKQGNEFYEMAARVTNQPHFHAREFLKLKDLYDVHDLDIIMKHCLENNILKIDNIKTLIKDKYLSLIIEYEKTDLALAKTNKSRYSLKNEEKLVRHLDYYTKGGQEKV